MCLIIQHLLTLSGIVTTADIFLPIKEMITVNELEVNKPRLLRHITNQTENIQGLHSLLLTLYIGSPNQPSWNSIALAAAILSAMLLTSFGIIHPAFIAMPIWPVKKTRWGEYWTRRLCSDSIYFYCLISQLIGKARYSCCIAPSKYLQSPCVPIYVSFLSITIKEWKILNQNLKQTVSALKSKK